MKGRLVGVVVRPVRVSAVFAAAPASTTALVAALVVLCGLTAAVAPAAAQVVNIETQWRDPSALGWKGLAESSLTINRGNVTLLDLGGTVAGQHQTLHPHQPGLEEGVAPYLRTRFLMLGNARYSSNANGPFISRSFAHVRHTTMWHPRAGMELFAQHQFDLFLRLNTRVLVGGGGRFELVRTRNTQLSGGLSMMFDYEAFRLEEDAGLDPDERRFTARGNLYLALRVKPTKSPVQYRSVLYVQPAVHRRGDVRVLADNDLSIEITRRLSTALNVQVVHDSLPAPGAEETDLRAVQRLRYEW